MKTDHSALRMRTWRRCETCLLETSLLSHEHISPRVAFLCLLDFCYCFLSQSDSHGNSTQGPSSSIAYLNHTHWSSTLDSASSNRPPCQWHFLLQNLLSLSNKTFLIWHVYLAYFVLGPSESSFQGSLGGSCSKCDCLGYRILK